MNPACKNEEPDLYYLKCVYLIISSKTRGAFFPMQEQRYESNYMFPRRMLFFHANRSALVIRGLIFFILGLIGLLHPVDSMAVVTSVLGVFLLIEAAGALFLSIACRRFFGFIWSVLLCAAGIVMIVQPMAADTLIVLVLGLWLVISGAGELFSAPVSPSRAILSGSGVISILFGILLLVAPLAGVTVFTWFIAILLLISGAGMLLLAFGIRASGLTAGDKRGEDGQP